MYNLTELPKLHKKYVKSLVYFTDISQSIPLINNLENKTNTKRLKGEYSLICFLFIVCMIIIGVFGYYSVNFICAYYPLVMTIKVI